MTKKIGVKNIRIAGRDSKETIKIIIIFVLLVIFFIFYQSEIRNSKYIKTQVFYEFADDKYDELIDLKNFRFVINSLICDECTEDFLVVVFIYSAMKNVDARTAIRNTWGRQKECVKFVYLVGISNNTNITNAIQKESVIYKDIVQGNFIDAYRNLTYKHIMGLKWVTYYCPKAKYVVKTDDDIMVHTSLLYQKLKNNDWGNNGLIACGIIRSPPVMRYWKWAVSKEEYPNDYYPNYCNGPFIVYSADVVRLLLGESKKVKFFWIEDVHVTGTLAKRLGINHTQLLDYWYLHDARDMMVKGPQNVKPVVYGPLNLSPKDIVNIWNAMQGINETTMNKTELRTEHNKIISR